jgi:multiple sugar transport system substrate-binding protein
MPKQRLSCLLAVLFVAGLAAGGCSASATPTPPTTAPTTLTPTVGPTTAGTATAAASSGAPSTDTCLNGLASTGTKELHILGFAGPEYDALTAIGKDYTAKTGVKITVEDIGRTDIETRLKTRFAAKTGDFDMAFTENEPVDGYADAGWVAPIDDQLASNPCFDKSTYIDSMWPLVQYKGKTWGLPFEVPIVFFYYRTDLIQTPPQTWADLVTVAQQFTKSINPSSPTKYGITFATEAEYGYKYWFTFLNEFGGKVFDANGNVVINSPEGVASLQYLVDLVKKYKVAPPEVTTSLYPDTEALIQNGDVAMALQWNAAAAELTSATKSPKIGGKIGVAMYPGVKQADGSVLVAPYLHAQTLIVNAASPNIAEAVRFMAWYNTEKNARTATTFGETPPLAALYADPSMAQQLGSWWTMMGAYLKVAVGTPPSPVKAIWAMQLSTDINQAISGQASTQDALNTAAQQIVTATKGQ